MSEEIKKIYIKTDTVIQNNTEKENSSHNFPRYQCPDGKMVGDSLHKTGQISPNQQAEVNEKVRTEESTNACVYLLLLILDNVKTLLTLMTQVSFNN